MFAAHATLTAFLIAIGAIAGFAGTDRDAGERAAAMVTGTVTYRERIALPPNAVIIVRLVDVSRADAPAVVLDEQRIPSAGKQPPFAFALTYDPARIDQRFTYAVQARIEVDGQLWFISTSRYAVITQGNPTQVDIVVQRASGGGGEPPTGLPSTGHGGGSDSGDGNWWLTVLALIALPAGWLARRAMAGKRRASLVTGSRGGLE